MNVIITKLTFIIQETLCR